MALELTSSFEVLDPRFRKFALPYIHVEKLYTGCRWAEGPAWFAAGRYLVWSDIPNDRVMRWDETDGSVSVFRQPSMNSNGHTVDQQGRLISCEHRSRWVSRTEFDGRRTVLAGRHEGKRFNSPNDVVVKSDGSVSGSPIRATASTPTTKATRPQRDRRRPRLSHRCVQRAGQHRRVGLRAAQRTRVFTRRISAVHRRYGRHAQGGRAHHVRRFQVSADGRSLAGGEVFATCPVGVYDGLRIDVHGNLWLSAGDGVHCHASDGSLLGKIRIPEAVANVCFGGPKLNRLFICATTSLYSVFLHTRAAPRPAGRDRP